MAVVGGAAGAAMLVAAIAGMAISAYGSIQSAQYQSSAMQYNAALAAQQAGYAQQAAGLEAELLEKQAAGTLAMHEAGLALSEAQARAGVLAAEAAGSEREAAIRRAYEKAQGEVNAAIGASGVDTTGSPLLALLHNADTVGHELAVNDYQTKLEKYGAELGGVEGVLAAAAGRNEAQSLRGEATLRRFGGSSAATGFMSQAGMLRSSAGAVRTAGFVNAGSTLLTSLGNVGSTFIRYGAKA